eukprot:CAMPEP_0179018596 /NCGR_PEP_ID=MMETSP0796-20121207/4435_1 /TAXON_ID=73915 /ORGANISM="Pyrodinium bahamense, Strain pbaha01" /LENGTH=196 /DNA_ID=CAMNT_0020714359 /DNA_START=209 /DNA_END=800 /DNA_ORIENTATION=-
MRTAGLAALGVARVLGRVWLVAATGEVAANADRRVAPLWVEVAVLRVRSDVQPGGCSGWPRPCSTCALPQGGLNEKDVPDSEVMPAAWNSVGVKGAPGFEDPIEYVAALHPLHAYAVRLCQDAVGRRMSPASATGHEEQQRLCSSGITGAPSAPRETARCAVPLPPKSPAARFGEHPKRPPSSSRRGWAAPDLSAP